MREIRNLLFNPRPSVPGREEFEIYADAIVTYLPNEVKITATPTDSCALRDITLPAGDWVYSAYADNYTGSGECVTAENLGLHAYCMGGEFFYELFTGIDKRYTLQFHLDAESLVTLTMVGPSTVGESLSWSRMILASKQDYDAMRALNDAYGQPLNLTWFDGDTYPRNSGGGSAS